MGADRPTGDERPAFPDVRELRLALVCYGGVSLAIYMHGVTKEIQKLVAASATFELDEDHNPFGKHETEWVCWDVLAELRRRDGGRRAGPRTKVVVDIISGTSAGGINGICLAKGLARNRSQDALRDLWLEEGDITKLLTGPSWLPSKLKPIAWLAQTLPNPFKAKPPLRGDEMSRLLHRAFEDMDEEPPLVPDVDSLAPKDHVLDLFVPITDFGGYERAIPLDVSLLAPDETKSPDEPKPPDEPKLSGVSIAHFGAFFSRQGRENDYLWGRLDAAETLITLLLDDPEHPGVTPPDPVACRPAFEAILTDEASLTHVQTLLGDLRRRTASLTETPATPPPEHPCRVRTLASAFHQHDRANKHGGFGRLAA